MMMKQVEQFSILINNLFFFLFLNPRQQLLQCDHWGRHRCGSPGLHLRALGALSLHVQTQGHLPHQRGQGQRIRRDGRRGLTGRSGSSRRHG
ncbi:hypothetical protein QTP70_035046 [Hemibagrus guttatus]|uniref:Uncharacterized protein n=1 Tax=Hemibagrus guttatus TaxID=175788 RepID=A0AAE0V9J1_9TELE|nr:hypothetical protein QTP70_035046 [Hemibagrus guttatus]